MIPAIWVGIARANEYTARGTAPRKLPYEDIVDGGCYGSEYLHNRKMFAVHNRGGIYRVVFCVLFYDQTECDETRNSVTTKIAEKNDE